MCHRWRAADRVGRPLVTIVAMAISGTCALVIGPSHDAPLSGPRGIAIVWGSLNRGRFGAVFRRSHGACADSICRHRHHAADLSSDSC